VSVKNIVRVFIIFIFTVPLHSASSGALRLPQSLQGSIRYRWGDSPNIKNGKLLRLQSANDSSGWIPVNNFFDVPKIASQKNLWVKLRLDKNINDYSAILIDRIERIFEVYLDTTKIYSFGEFTSDEHVPCPGFAWHLINLPGNCIGKELFFRIRSDSKYIGFYSDVRIGTEEYFLSEVIKSNLSKTILGMIFLCAGLSLFIILLFVGKMKPFLGIVIFMTTNGIWTLANTKLTQLLIYAPKLFYYADHLALIASAVGFFMITVQIIEAGYKKYFTKVYQFFAGYLLVVAILDITGLSDNLDTVAPFLIGMVVVVLFLIYFIFLSARKGNREAKLFLSALAVYAVFALLDIINYFQNVVLNPYTFEMQYAHYGGFLFLTFIGWILLLRYIEMNKMMILAQVNERTRIAQDLHDEVGPRLTEIKMVSESVKNISSLSQEEQRKVDELSAATNKVVSTLSEIVWALNPTNDTLEEFAGYVSQTAINFLQKADIRCRIDMPPEFPEMKISYEVRRNILMAVSESLNNIAKHADASLVTIQITMRKTWLTIFLTCYTHERQKKRRL